MNNIFSLTYKNKSFNQRASDNYVNLGELCSTHNKRFHNWSRTQNAKDYLEALAETLTESGAHFPAPLIQKDKDASGGDAGTWAHPLVAIEVARWISPEFGVWCNQHIKTLIETGSTQLIDSHELQEKTTDALIKVTNLLEASMQKEEMQKRIHPGLYPIVNDFNSVQTTTKDYCDKRNIPQNYRPTISRRASTLQRLSTGIQEINTDEDSRNILFESLLDGVVVNMEII